VEAHTNSIAELARYRVRTVGTKNDHLGEPLGFNNLGERMFDPLIRKTDPRVKRITVHGLRHTAATLMLNAGIPVHVVAARLGHSNVNITWQTYTHVLKDAHQDAAAILGKVLHGDDAESASKGVR
jgi:integrase